MSDDKKDGPNTFVSVERDDDLLESLKDATAVEIDGFKIVDASGQDLPPEFLEAFLTALIESGQIIRDDAGNLRRNDDFEDGQLVGVDLSVDDDGTLTVGDVEAVTYADLPPGRRPH